VAAGKNVLQFGDAIVAVGTRAMLDQFQRVIGRRSDEDLRLAPGHVTHRRIVVTHKDVLGRTLAELDLDSRCGAVVSRVTRADIELAAVPGLRLQFGDMVRLVGEEEGLNNAERLLGNSVKELNETHSSHCSLASCSGSPSGRCRLRSRDSRNQCGSVWRVGRSLWRSFSVDLGASDGWSVTCP